MISRLQNGSGAKSRFAEGYARLLRWLRKPADDVDGVLVEPFSIANGRFFREETFLVSTILLQSLGEGLPHPTLGGVWGKISPEAKKSYLFVDFTEENIDQVIELAKAGGVSYILNYGGTWATSSGRYEVNLKNFPNGLAGVKAVMGKIYAAGLKGGAHILSGCIDKDNAYVTPVPDPRLARDDGESASERDPGLSPRTAMGTVLGGRQQFSTRRSRAERG
jgi:hypothetical protein